MQKFFEYLWTDTDKSYLIEADSNSKADTQAILHCGADFTPKPCGCCGADWINASSEPDYTDTQAAITDYFGKDAKVIELDESDDASYVILFKNGDEKYYREVV